LNQSQIEKLKNEIISRRDDETVPLGTVRRSNEEMGHFLASRCGRANLGHLLRCSLLTYLKVRSAPRALNITKIRSAQLTLGQILHS